MLAHTPPPPYYAVIFSSIKNEELEGYNEMAAIMEDLAKQQPGFLGMESASSDIGITVSYWKDEMSILRWKNHADHLVAQQKGKEKWYKSYITRICKVERAYDFNL